MPLLTYCQLDHEEQISVKCESNYNNLHSRKCIRKMPAAKWQPHCLGLMQCVYNIKRTTPACTRLSGFIILSNNMGPIHNFTVTHYIHYWLTGVVVNTMEPEQNGRLLADDTFKCDSFNENYNVLFWISLKIVHRDPLDNKSQLVKLMAWYRTLH